MPVELLKFSQDLVETSQDLTWQCDAEGRYTYLDPAWESVFGYRVDEMLGRKFTDFQSPEYAARDGQAFARLMEGGILKGFETVHIGKSGDRIHLVFNSKAVRDAGGQILGTRGTAHDFTERKRAEEALRESEEKYRGLVDHSPDAIAIYVEGVIVYVNDECLRVMAATKKEELIGKPVILFVHPDDRALVIQRMTEVVLDGRALPAEKERFIRFDGTTVDVEVKAMPVVFERKPAVQIIVRDVTERRRAEEALRESEQLYRSLFENLLNGFAYCRMLFDEGRPVDFVYLVVNDAFETQTGLKNVVGRRVSEVIPGIREADPQLFEIYGRVALTGQPDRFEVYLESMQMWFLISVYSPEYGYFVAVFDVVTERKLAEAVLRESEERFRTLYENSTIGLYRTTIDGKVILANPTLVKMLGYASFEELAAKNLEESGFEPSYDRKHFIEQIEETGEIKDLESAWTRKDGSTIHIKETARSLRDPSGKLLYFDGTVEDITERKTTEQLLRDMQRRESLGVLTSGIAHDFNNLLGTMMGNVSLALTRLPADHAASQNIEKALSAMERAAELTQQMLAYSGKGKFQIRSIDIGAVVQEHVSLFNVSLPKNVKLVTHLPAAPVYVNGDPGQIEQIIMNLIINEGDAIGEKQGVVSILLALVELGTGEAAAFGRLTNAALKKGTYALLEVRDSGIGMSPETMNRIFDPFFTTKFTGRGLGLSAVLGIIRGHEGGIIVESKEGEGTLFRLILPAAAPQAPPENAAAAEPHVSVPVSPTILVIDDEEDVATMAQEILAAGKYETLIELNPVRGIEVYRQHHAEIGLVLLDLTMPEMSGKDVVDALHAINPAVKIILSSGYSEDEVTKKIGAGRVEAFIQKPYRLQSLLALVRTVLAKG